MGWRQYASCSDSDPELWFPLPTDEETTAYAIKVCNDCPVKAECLEFASSLGVVHGIWGGTTELERTAARKGTRLITVEPAPDTKCCTRCRQWRATAEFVSDFGKPTMRCRRCRAIVNLWERNKQAKGA